jgi:hypothetical protein
MEKIFHVGRSLTEWLTEAKDPASETYAATLPLEHEGPCLRAEFKT